MFCPRAAVEYHLDVLSPTVSPGDRTSLEAQNLSVLQNYVELVMQLLWVYFTIISARRHK